MVKIQAKIDFFKLKKKGEKKTLLLPPTESKKQIPRPAANVHEGGFFLVIEHL